MGWADNLDQRLEDHRHQRGAKITAAAVRAGATLEVVYTAPGTRHDERRIKNYKNTAKWLERWQAQQAKRAVRDETYRHLTLGTFDSVNFDYSERFRRQIYSVNVRTRSGRLVRAELDSIHSLGVLGVDISELHGRGAHRLPETYGVSIHAHQSVIGSDIGIEHAANEFAPHRHEPRHVPQEV